MKRITKNALIIIALRAMPLAVALAVMCVAANAAPKTPVPTVAGVPLSGSLDAVSSSLAKRGFIMTGRTTETAELRGTMYGMEDVPLAMSHDGSKDICRAVATLPGGDDWRHVKFTYDAVVASLKEEYGEPFVQVSEFGGDREYSAATKMIRLSKGYVDVHASWRHGDWLVMAAVGYERYEGVVKVTMEKTAPLQDEPSSKAAKKKRVKAAKQPKPQKQPKVKKASKNESNQEKSPTRQVTEEAVEVPVTVTPEAVQDTMVAKPVMNEPVVEYSPSEEESDAVPSALKKKAAAKAKATVKTNQKKKKGNAKPVQASPKAEKADGATSVELPVPPKDSVAATAGQQPDTPSTGGIVVYEEVTRRVDTVSVDARGRSVVTGSSEARTTKAARDTALTPRRDSVLNASEEDHVILRSGNKKKDKKKTDIFSTWDD